MTSVAGRSGGLLEQSASGSTIESIEAFGVRIPLEPVVSAARFSRRARDIVVTRLRTSDGVEGICFNAVTGTDPVEVARVITQDIAPVICGHSAFAIERTLQLAVAATYRYQRDWRVMVRARACVDSAQWDAIGKLLGQPLFRVWGGELRDLPVIVWGGAAAQGATLDDVAQEMATIRAMGGGGCKFKVGYLNGLTPAQDAQRLRAAREAAGADFLLIADANQGWTRAEALDFAHRVEDLNLLWIEEPCRWPNDRRDLALVRKATRVPIAGGQMEITAEGCRDLMLEGAIDYCNFDASWGGGPSVWRKVAALAEAHGIPITQHQESHFGGHLVLSVKDGVALEVYPPYLDPPYYEMMTERPRFENGMYRLSEAPGWGFDLDWDFVARYALASMKGTR